MQKEEVRLFFANDFSISGNDVGDTAAFDPKTGGVVITRMTYTLLTANRRFDGLAGFAIGQKGVGGLEGPPGRGRRCSQEIQLLRAQDSVISVSLEIEGTSGGQLILALRGQNGGSKEN
jgi:hypothetical protein